MTRIETPSGTSAAKSAPNRRRFDEDANICDGVIVFGNVDWWYHNRGHSSTRIATRLSRRVPTLYVNSIGMRMPVPGRTEIAWRRYLRKLRSLTRGLRRDEASGLWVYTPLFVPRYSPRWLEFNGALLASQVRLLARRLGMRRPSALVAMPTMTPAAERLPWVRVVFERCDDFTTLPEADAQRVAALERRLLDLCDHAAYVSPELWERERDTVADARLVGHGVDFDLLAGSRPEGRPAPEEQAPPGLRGLPRPVVGFFGGMDDYRMDADLMVKVARQIAPGTLVLIGPAQMDLSRVKAEPNVRHIGQVVPEQLGSHAACFDVGIIPFLRNDFNRRSSPIKLKEYLALGFPVVAMNLPAYAPYLGLIHTAETHEEFLESLDRALTEDNPEATARRRSAVAGESWEAIAQGYAEMLGLAVKGGMLSGLETADDLRGPR
ncbi:glycosyltransferase family 1 protein [soil metagenome]